MRFVIITEQLFDFCCFRAMTVPLKLTDNSGSTRILLVMLIPVLVLVLKDDF